MVSLALRSAVPTDAIISQLMGISCQNQHGIGKTKTMSCADALAKALKMHVERAASRGRAASVAAKYRAQAEAIEAHLEKVRTVTMGACPECGASLVHEGGCHTCYVCGYSKCS